MRERKKGVRVANTLRKLAEAGTAAGYVPDDEHSQVHEASEHTVQWVDIDLVKDSPFQHEEQIDAEKFASLVSSIQEHGLWHAFNVMEDPQEPGTYLLTNGMHQRRNAAKAAGYTRVAVYVGPPLDQKHLAVRAARENTTDVNRSKVNLGYLFAQMNEQLGMTQEEIAVEIGQTREFVKLCLLAAKSAPDIQRMIFEKPESIRAMTYLRRIKPNIKPEEEATISDEVRAEREAEAVAWRAPIIEKFLRGDLSTDGVLAEVERVLANLEESKQETKEALVVALAPEVIHPRALATTHETRDASKISERPSLASEQDHAHRVEEEKTGTNALEPTPVPPASASLQDQRASSLSERMGQAKAALSRLKTYQRALADDALSEKERVIFEEVERIVHQLLVRESS